MNMNINSNMICAYPRVQYFVVFFVVFFWKNALKRRFFCGIFLWYKFTGKNFVVQILRSLPYPPASQGPKKRKYFDILRPICAQRPWICSETCLHHRKNTFRHSDEGSRLIDVWKSRKRDLRSVVTSARFVPKTSFKMSF